MPRLRVVVVGAGVGGLVSALELAAQGVEVTVVEQADAPGGKMRQVSSGGRPMDAGPTVFTMRWVFEELFAAIGERLQDHLTLQPLAVLARHAWGAGEHFDLHADLERTVAAIASFSSPAEGERYRQFAQRAADICRTLEAPFLRAPRPGPLDLVRRAGWRGLPGLLRISPFATLWGELAKTFRDPRLAQLFARYATYCGSSPYLAPATLMLVAHVEREGVWSVQGGMHRVAQCLAALAQRRGAEFRWGSAVSEVLVQGGRVSGVQLARGERIAADAVVFNGDVAALAAGRLGAAARAAVPAVKAGAAARSLSALVWNFTAPATGFPLLRHNVFFSSDYRAEFDDLLVRGQVPRDPTVYVCAQDRADAPMASGAAERLLVLVNAPALGDAGALSMKELSSCQERTFQVLQRCGLKTAPPADGVLTQPADFERLFPATGGALYGRPSHGWRASFQRPASRTRLPGLYLAGGSTHPGPGVPMAALSGRLAAAGLLADTAPRRVSTPPWRAAATPGGTSTR